MDDQGVRIAISAMTQAGCSDTHHVETFPAVYGGKPITVRLRDSAEHIPGVPRDSVEVLDRNGRFITRGTAMPPIEAAVRAVQWYKVRDRA